MKSSLFGLVGVLLIGCSSQHQVTVLLDPDEPVKYVKGEEESKIFSNRFPGKKIYPTTCEADCYPESEYLICNSEEQHCQFVGTQTQPNSFTGFSVKWLGHASFLITTPDEQSWLLDPVSDQFDSPVDWAFRLVGGIFRKPVDWSEINRRDSIDAVFYSHIHYDHFNKSDIERLGTNPKYYVPLAFSDYFPHGAYDITEMGWFAATQLGQTNIHFVPANHFSSRIWVPFVYSDTGKSLWGGWLFEHDGKKLFFAGDTGYSDHFKEINSKYGDIDVCLLPIASYYHPTDGEWYRYVHTTPEDAIAAAQDLNCKVVIPWGYGNNSWLMGDIDSHSALKRLLHMNNQMNSNLPLYILNEGDAVSL